MQIRRALTILLALCLAAGLESQAARPYAQVARDLPAVWKARFAVPAEFTPDPGKRGILAAELDGRIVYYYHFHASVGILVRDGDDVKSTGTRTVELWVRHSAAGYELSFERMDRLPGQAKRWIR